MIPMLGSSDLELGAIPSPSFLYSRPVSAGILISSVGTARKPPDVEFYAIYKISNMLVV